MLAKKWRFHQFTESLFLQLEDEYHLNELNKEVQQRDKGRITEAIKHLDSTLNTISTYIKSFGKNKLIFRLLKCVEKEVQEISKNLNPIIDFMYARRGGLSESEDDSDDSAEVLYPSWDIYLHPAPTLTNHSAISDGGFPSCIFNCVNCYDFEDAILFRWGRYATLVNFMLSNLQCNITFSNCFRTDKTFI